MSSSSVAAPVVSSSKYKLLSPAIDALQCPVCLDVASDPWQHNQCGKVFCRECVEKHGKKKPCPNCRGKQPYFEDRKSECL